MTHIATQRFTRGCGRTGMRKFHAEEVVPRKRVARL
eukprot:CAMPEP_0182574588 /NCGR_PEP_ID=MMETSP1324-20130603/26278_1 /TAXON_ID=236786 /ORGANISM="Florenciella sp., Strain RCC1587" /LENGTH=35 /DNA_ID= /DNA_START= /DNA_END= /DNA_ORIENTATION=